MEYGDSLAVFTSGIQKHAENWPNSTAHFRASSPLENGLGLVALTIMPMQPGSKSIAVRAQQRLVQNQSQSEKDARQQADNLSNIESVLWQAAELCGEKVIPFRNHSRWSLDFAQWTPCVTLPLIQIRFPGTPYQRISGVRLSSDRSDGAEYAILDMTSATTFTVALSFTFESPVSVHLCGAGVEAARRARDLVIIRKLTEA